MKQLSLQVNVWKLVSISLAILIVLTQYGLVTISHKDTSLGNVGSNSSEVSSLTVFAQEIYPEFTCPCCDTPLHKEDPCCGAMSAMVDFIDSKAIEGLSEEEIMIATMKEFGMDRLTDESRQDEIRQLLASQAPEDASTILIDVDSQDLGQVIAGSGVISTDFTITNSGKSDLEINKIDSSCGCTSAAIEYQGQEGPKFGMAGHGFDNPTDWTVSVAPGDTATLRVYYDPSTHPDLVGAVTRTITVYSNDPVEFAKKVTITLEQVE
ncbi:DUF1573 domain-containing protein [bacterium]|nr:DUF1573 domain-containing protein [bacterium]